MTSTRRVASVIAVAAIMVVAGIAVGAGAGPVAAQDDDDEIPALPAVYHGELTVADGELEEPVLVEAVADGEVQDSMEVDTDGAIGGPTISDDKLEVQQPDDGSVEFHIGGEPVTILSLDGDTENDESIDWESGTQEIELEVDAERLEPDFDVEIDSTNSPIEAGEELDVEVTLSNVGAGETTADADLLAFDNSTVDSTTTTLEQGAETTTTLVWNTTEDDVGNGTITVGATDNTDTTTVELEQPEPDDIADPDPGGVGSQPSLGDGDDDGDDGDDGDDADTPALDDGVIHTETQSIATSEEFDISQVRFTEGAGIASITWDTAAIEPGPVGVETYNETPAAVDPVPGAMISLSEITLSANVTDEPATVELRADRERLAAADADIEDLRIVRYTDDGWTPLETTVSEEDDAFVTLEADTPGFSFFAVQATGEPTATIDAPDEVTVEDDATLSGADSTTEYGEITDYEWTINGETTTGETVIETFDEVGDVTVELTVTNDAGETDTATTELSVAEPEPETETDDGIPGFGVIVALAGLLAAALLARRL